RGHEIGRSRRLADVLVRRRTPLGVIGLEQTFRRRAAQHAIELPGDVLSVFQPGIGAACAEWRNLMRGIAGKDHAAMDETVHAPALELVERTPFEIALVVA